MQEPKERKLGVGMSTYDTRVEELENILKWVMYSVDSFLEGDDFDNCEIERAAIMHRKITNLLSEKNDRIRDLEKELQRKKFFGLIGK